MKFTKRIIIDKESKLLGHLLLGYPYLKRFSLAVQFRLPKKGKHGIMAIVVYYSCC